MDHPVGGDGTTINVAQCSWWDAGELADLCVGDEGSLYRAVASFDDEGWLAGHYSVFPFREADVAARTVSEHQLE